MRISDWSSDVCSSDLLLSVTSIITTTGFVSYDWQLWGPFAAAVALMLTFSGGCTGSTTGGIKIFRWQVMIRRFRIGIQEQIRPHRVVAQSYQGRPGEPAARTGEVTFGAAHGDGTAIAAVVSAATRGGR